MEKKKITIIGVGGRTGTMFAFELAKRFNVLGVGREREIEMIKNQKLWVERKGEPSQVFKENIVKDTEFHNKAHADIIFLTIKNPISPAIKYYFQGLGGRFPALLISQNGISAIADAKKTLQEIFGSEWEKIRLVRVILFNPVDTRQIESRTHIKYSLPIRVSLAKASGKGDIKDIIQIFKNAGFEAEDFTKQGAKNLEYSKLFLNLIGMASASRGISIKQGFRDRETFEEEAGVIKEYVKAVKLSEGRFLNLPNYPVKFFANFFDFLPMSFLMPLRSIIAGVVSRGREGKPKVLDEIHHYNGGVIQLGRRVGIKTPINEKICQRVLEKLKRI